jgi:hypothetical protein
VVPAVMVSTSATMMSFVMMSAIMVMIMMVVVMMIGRCVVVGKIIGVVIRRIVGVVGTTRQQDRKC